MKRLRGFNDYIFNQNEGFNAILQNFNQLVSAFSYKTLYLPTVENITLYTNTLGDSSDVVQKEMYSFFDRSGTTQMVLRPEGTAGFVRAFLENDWANTYPLPLKVAYSGSMFRYERPQKGRRREFRQLGIETVSLIASPYLDAEAILLAYKFLKMVFANTKESFPVLHLNTLGDAESRANYTKHLKTFLQNHYADLSQDSKTRFDKQRYLRILDSKDSKDQTILKQAPLMHDFLNQSSQDYYHKLQNLLTLNNINFVHNPLLVRGLDYYQQTVFEFQQDNLTLLAGGRYIANKKLRGVGWAAGLERLLPFVTSNPRKKLIVLCSDNIAGLDFIYSNLFNLNLPNFSLNFNYKELKLKKSLQFANDNQADYLIFVNKNDILVKNLETGQNNIVPKDFKELLRWF